MSYPRIVVDTNKILAAILRPGRVREMLFNIPAVAITPCEAWREIEKHIGELVANKGVPRDRLEALLDGVRREVIACALPREPHASTARGIASRFDPDDWPFIALALQYNAPIWTNDRGLLRGALHSRRYKALDTRALDMLLEGRDWREVEEYLRRAYGGRPPRRAPGERLVCRALKAPRAPWLVWAGVEGRP